MKYGINTKNYHDFSVISKNRLKARSYFIPFASAQEEAAATLLTKRYSSSLVKVLNGVWDFKYYANPNDLPSVLNTDKIAFDALEVPSCWQYKGYGSPCYLNVRYQFPYKPPVIPTTKPVTDYWSAQGGAQTAPEGEYNHAGVYRTCFDISDTGRHYIISFLGVCSCIDVYLNGAFVGYSEGSHNTAEFDLSSLVRSGRNELVCIVRRWCSGTYLECQDMFRNTGIFRDVLLREESDGSVYDLDVKTSRTENGYELSLTVETRSDCPVTARLEGHGLSLTASAVAAENKAEFCFACPDAKEWNAEYPNLYDLYIETPGSFVHQRTGFKTVEIRGDRFLFNGRAIKFHGVNHHDTDPYEGYCMTPEKLDRDLRLCKEYNIDTVRTSHYAPDPLLPELAAEYGLYVVDETDLETHGVFAQKLPPNYNRISDDPAWMPRYLDRVEHHYGRDKLLATPIFMWSLGNESGAGCNTDAMYDYLHSVSDIPVHYESAVHNSKIMAYDVASEMYPEVSRVEAIGAKKWKNKKLIDRPYFLCEYAHAMGVGPGNIEGYWDAIYSHESLMGGCIWEMNDHAVREKDGSFTYGGDHGEWIHDGNFCCDGLFYPDRSPSTGAFIAKHCYAPLRLRLGLDNRLEILNTTGFSDGGCFKLNVSLSDGRKLEYVPACGPLETEFADIGLCGAKGELFADIETVDLRTGAVRDVCQFIINPAVRTAPEERTALPEWFGFEDGRPVIKLGESTACGAEEFTLLYRAATDNDKKNFIFPTMTPWYKEKELPARVKAEDGRIEAVSRITVGIKCFTATDVYEGVPGGVLVTSRLSALVSEGVIPRFGKCFRLPESFEDVKWFGCRDEAYNDMRLQTVVGEYRAKAADMHEPNVKPQESGNRPDTRYAELTDGKYTVRFEAVGESFNLGVKPYSDRELTEMKHRCDEITTGTYVTLSAFQQGIGTGSCGPSTLPEHMYPADRNYEFSYIISVTEN